MFDIISLCSTSNFFFKMMFNTQCKSIFKMNNLCSNKAWNKILNINFSNYLGRLWKELQDDLDTFLYLRYRLSTFILDNRISLHMAFTHFCFCKRTCDKKKNSSERYCKLCSRIYPQFFDECQYLDYIITDERNFTRTFIKVFHKISLFSLDICHNDIFFINTVKAKHFGCTQYLDIRTPNGLFIFYLSILIRLYLKHFFLY